MHMKAMKTIIAQIITHNMIQNKDFGYKHRIAQNNTNNTKSQTLEALNVEPNEAKHK